MKKAICIALATLMIILALVSCSKNNKTSDTEANGEACFPAEKLKEADVIIPDDSSDELKELVAIFTEKLNSLYGTSVVAVGESEVGDVSEYAIIIGSTSKSESCEFLYGLRVKDYGYGLVGKRLVIAGHSEETTKLAISKFIGKNFTFDNAKEIFFEGKDTYIFKDTYKISSLLLNGNPIEEYSIVYAVGDGGISQKVATYTRDMIASESGFYLTIKSDSEYTEGERSVIIGDSGIVSEELKTKLGGVKLTQGQYYLGAEENAVWIYSLSETGMKSGVKAMLSQIMNIQTSIDEIKIEIEDSGVVDFAKYIDITAMSYNIYYDLSNNNSRANLVIDQIKKYKPDTVGMQEATYQWIIKFKENNALGADYDYVGLSRDGSYSGEFNPIFYKKSVYNLIDSGTKWLSDTPDVPSKYSGSDHNRIMTFAVLERKSDGAKYIHVNTHLEYKDEAVMEKQANALIKQIKLLKQKYNVPVIISGDFNSEIDMRLHNTIKAEGFVNAMQVTPDVVLKPTFTSEGKTIDHIYGTENRIDFTEYYVYEDKINGNMISDHCPVFVKFNIK